MPASIFVPMVQVAIQNLGLAVFVALGMEEDDRNPGYLWERPCLFPEVVITATCCYSKAGTSKKVLCLEVKVSFQGALSQGELHFCFTP